MMVDMEELPACPKCQCEYTYEINGFVVCPECAHEWSATHTPDIGEGERVVKDAVGNILTDGDTVTIVKDLKIKGSPNSIKVGTKLRGIRLIDGPGDHDIDAKVEGFGQMALKSSVVKKVL